MTKKWTGVLELLIAAGLWGFGFIGVTWALEVLEPAEITFSRFVLGGLVGLPFILGKASRGNWKKNFKLSFWPALFLAGTLILQTTGLKYTSATKSGFITTLYVVFVPLLEALLKRKRLPAGIWLCVIMALVGTGLIVDIGISQINYGDVLTFFCALAATAQIYWMGEVSPRVKQPFTFNIYTCYWAAAFIAPLVHPHALWFKFSDPGRWTVHALIGMFSLVVGSTVIAFYLQVRAQSKLSATVSSLMFLLESPFAMFFSLALLGESLRPLEAMGAVIIFGSALLATWLES